MACVADPLDTCGGSAANQVYVSKEFDKGDYIGCYKDKATRALTGDWTNGADINNVVCMDRCAKKVNANSILDV